MTHPTTRKEIIKAWVEALRSGEYKQGKGRLRSTEGPTPTYCCLGVLVDVAYHGEDKEHFLTNCTYLSKKPLRELGAKLRIDQMGGHPYLSCDNGSRASLVHLNDRGETFLSIATKIETALLGDDHE